MLTTVFFSFLAISSDISHQIGQLKENKKNAEYNLEQYQIGIKAVETNLRLLKKTQEQLKKSAKASNVLKYEQDLTLLEKEKEKIADRLAEADRSQKSEDQAEKELMSALEEIQQRRKTREKVKKSLEKQMKEVAREMAELQAGLTKSKEIEKKNSSLAARLKKLNTEWSRKHSGYKNEIRRWQRELEKAKQTFRQVSDL